MFPNFAPKFVDRLASWMIVAVTGALIVAASAAYPQENPRPATIAITRGQWSRTICPADFKALEHAIEVEGQPGDRVVIEGEFVGGPLDILDLEKIVGGALEGPAVPPGEAYRGRFVSLARHDRIGPEENPVKPGGPAIWFPSTGSIAVRNLYLENSPEEVVEDGALTGWPGARSGDCAVLLENLNVKAHDWGLVYCWSLRPKHKIVGRNIRGVGARGFICLMSGSGGYQLDLEDCDLGIDGNLSVSYGASSHENPVTGGVLSPIMLRAGTGTAKNCTFWVRGMTPPADHPSKWVPTRIVSVATDQYYSKGATNTRFATENCFVKCVEPGPAVTASYDLDFRWTTERPSWNNQAAEDLARSEAEALLAAARGGTGPHGQVRYYEPPVVKASALAVEEDTKPD